jgi:hypothetical protein
MLPPSSGFKPGFSPERFGIVISHNEAGSGMMVSVVIPYVHQNKSDKN